jgi:hypothetical protein
MLYSKTTFVTFISVTIFFCFHLNALAGSKEDYQLEERCGKRAAERFKEGYGKGSWSDKDTSYTANYINHYNRKLNKCFVLLIGVTIRKNDKENLGTGTDKTLWDINENKQYGIFFKFSNMSEPTTCEVLGKFCYSETEWDSLVNPYMEE